jgi:hypothetical protein
MKREELIVKYTAIVERAILFNERAHYSGLLSLDDLIDENKCLQKDIFEYGIDIVIKPEKYKIDYPAGSGYDTKIIDKILTDIINLEKNDDEKLLKRLQKEAVVRLLEGYRSSYIFSSINSYMDFSSDEIMEISKRFSAFPVLKNGTDIIYIDLNNYNYKYIFTKNGDIEKGIYHEIIRDSLSKFKEIFDKINNEGWDFIR